MEVVDVEPGDVVVAGCLLGEENHCPLRGALGFKNEDSDERIYPMHDTGSVASQAILFL
ncbi:MAG: hypothetical protein LN409_05290 [Candidatus Thermoplasmatota archaeon]|nr:hypothetical protein [Candidatus Thermoplasmatota archaeon]